MSRLDKLTRQFVACTGPFPFRDFVRLIEGNGYALLHAGKTGGSRRKFYNKETGKLLLLDEPHDGIMGPSMVRRLRQDLEEGGVI